MRHTRKDLAPGIILGQRQGNGLADLGPAYGAPEQKAEEGRAWPEAVPFRAIYDAQ